jgi:hypothetical protein
VSLVAAALVLGACAQPQSDEALDRGRALEAALHSLGYTMKAEEAAWIFGEDGGHLCADDLANRALAGHRFALRKTKVRLSDVEFARVVVDVYCPEQRQRFDDYVAGLATENDLADFVRDNP